jgi:archaemetzincin
MHAAPHRIGVLPIGELHDIVPKVIAAHISGYLNLEATVLSPVDRPSYAFHEERVQYNVGAILQALEEKPIKGIQKIVGVLNVDLFVPVFTHVYGEARQGGRVALVSLFRLGEDPVESIPPSAAMLERAAKVALHELCHLYNLTHCETHDCLMHFSGSLDDLDNISFRLCRYCTSFFRNAVRLEP